MPGVTGESECAVGRTAQRHRPPCPSPVVRTVHLPPVGGLRLTDIPLCAEHNSEFEAHAESQGLRIAPSCSAGRLYRLTAENERFATWGSPCTAAGTATVRVTRDDGSDFSDLVFCQQHFDDLRAAGVLSEQGPLLP